MIKIEEKERRKVVLELEDMKMSKLAEKDLIKEDIRISEFAPKKEKFIKNEA